MSFPSLRPSKLLGLTALAIVAARAVTACGGSTADSNDGDDAGTIIVPNDAGQAHDAASPSDASTPVDASVPVDSSTPVDAGHVQADLALDFSKTVNPGGAWTYGYSLGEPGGDASALIVYPSVHTDGDIVCWYDENNVSLGAPATCINGGSTTTSTGVAPGEAALHPGQKGEYSIARWTAPVAGSYVVSTQFKTGDTGETSGALVKNGTVLWTVDMTSTNPTDTRTLTLAAGDTLDVAVGNDGDYLFDTTPTLFSVHTAP